MRLPNEYQEVEYIESSGTQYINTGFIPTNNTKVKLSMGGFSGTGNAHCLFGVRAARSADASIGRGLQFSVNATTTPRDYAGMFGRNYGTASGMTSGMFAWADGGDYILEVSQSGFYENGVNKFTPQTVTFTSPVDLYIFSNNTNGTISEMAPYKLYFFEIYESGTLVRDFVPCYRKSDGEIGIYDLIGNQFYTNAGTGVFTKGNDIGPTGKIQRIYLGTDLIRPTEITETYTLSDGVSLYKAGFKPQSIIYECDYYNPSSGWTGATLKIHGGNKTIGWYIWGGSNIGSYPNSDGKIEGNTGSGTTKIYDSVHKYIPKGTTRHLKVTFSREGISLKVGDNAEETYLYRSGTWGPTALSIMDSTNLQASYGPNTGATLSNGVATVTYSKA